MSLAYYVLQQLAVYFFIVLREKTIWQQMVLQAQALKRKVADTIRSVEYKSGRVAVEVTALRCIPASCSRAFNGYQCLSYLCQVKLYSRRKQNGIQPLKISSVAILRLRLKHV